MAKRMRMALAEVAAARPARPRQVWILIYSADQEATDTFVLLVRSVSLACLWLKMFLLLVW